MKLFLTQFRTWLLANKVNALILGLLCLFAGAVLGAEPNVATVTESPGTSTTVYRGSSTMPPAAADYADCKAKALADAITRKPGTYSYGCQDARDKLSIKVTKAPVVVPPPVVPPPPPPPPAVVWTRIMQESSPTALAQFQLTKPADVRFGTPVGSRWTVKRLAAGTHPCDYSFFPPDPAVGEAKYCETSDASAIAVLPPVTPPVVPPSTWAPSQQNGRYNIMPLGDSITASCCWRDILSAALTSGGYPFAFVGSAGGHEGHGGYSASTFTTAAGATDLAAWFGPSAATPDVVLLMLGTNDRWAAKSPAEILAGYSAALNAMRAKNPRVTVLVAQILPMVPADVKPLNDAIPGWATANSTSASRIIVVNQNAGFSVAWLRPSDGVHIEAAAGNQWVSDHWLAALTPILQKGSAPTPPVVPTPPPPGPPPVTQPEGSPIPAPAASFFTDLRIMPYTGNQPAVPASDGVGAFRNPCGYSHMRFDDPIKYPGVVGGSHLHTYFDNPSLSATSTLATLLAARASTCAGGIANLSAYWIPSLIDTTTNRALVPFENLIYYKSGYNAIPRGSLVFPPNGLEIIAGNFMSTTGPVQGAPFEYRCNGVYDPNMSWQDRQKIPDCAPGSFLLVMLMFPNCWNGQLKATDPEHRNNMAYSGGGTCPASHPIGIPTISLNIKYWITAGMKLRFSSDMNCPSDKPGCSMHGDAIVAWEDRTIVDAWMNYCVRAGNDCHGFLLGDGRTTY